MALCQQVLVDPAKLQVFSKLGGNFLGFVAKPWLEKLDDVLQFRGTNLTSCIPSELGNLSRLCYLYLSYNEHLHGELPQELNKLANLFIPHQMYARVASSSKAHG